MGELARIQELGWALPAPDGDGVHHFIDADEATLSYPEDGLSVLGLEGGAGYWFEHRASMVAQLAVQHGVRVMWEVGSGTGAMASRLVPPLAEVVTVEPLAEGARAAARQSLPSLCGTLQNLGLPDSSIPCIGAFDVIEHIGDVHGFLVEVRRVLQPGALVIVTVPAFASLWGDEDDFAGHQRRYKKSTLRAEFRDAGFTHVHSEYLYASLFAPAAITRALPYRLGRRRNHDEVRSAMTAQLDVTPLIDRLARRVLSTEAGLSRRIALPVGTSLLGAFQRSA